MLSLLNVIDEQGNVPTKVVHAIWLNGREMDLAPLLVLLEIVHA